MNETCRSAYWSFTLYPQAGEVAASCRRSDARRSAGRHQTVERGRVGSRRGCGAAPVTRIRSQFDEQRRAIGHVVSLPGGTVLAVGATD